MENVAVLGAGSWGTALATVLADNGHSVKLWSHRKEQVDEINSTRQNKQYLDVNLPENIQGVANIEEAVKGVTAIVIVIPAKAIREVTSQLTGLISSGVTLIHATKGIEPVTLKRVSEMIFEELPEYSKDDIVVLSGPSHAEEVAKRHPTTVTVAATSPEKSKHAQNLFNSETFRVYTSHDVLGLELGGALKNIIALGAGISDGLGYGDNAKAALITRGLAEITRLGTKLGANPMSFLGLSGVGDLIVTCTSVHSRNWRAGNMLGKGYSLDEVLAEMDMVVEGVRTVQAAYKIAKENKVEMPITTGIYEILFENKAPKDIVNELMNRDKREELAGLEQLMKELDD